MTSRPRRSNVHFIQFTEIESCPNCETSWVQAPIPERSRHLFGNSKWFSRVIGIYSTDKDATIAWQCPDCAACWDRATGKRRESFAAVTAHVQKQKEAS